MGGRSYLRRIAQPVVPGAPHLTPLPSSLAHEARPPAIQSTSYYYKVTPTIGRMPFPAALPAGLEASHPPAAAAGQPVVPECDAPGLEAEIGSVALPSAIASAQSDRGSPVRSTLSLAIEPEGAGDAEVLPDPRPDAIRTPDAIPSVHIGSVEVRTRPAPVPVPRPAPGRPPRTAPAAPQSPLSRGLAWRYGLVQG
jgi:hypothetical protein